LRINSRKEGFAMKNDHSASSMRAKNGFIHRSFPTGPPDRFNLADQVVVGLVVAFLVFCTPTKAEPSKNDFRHFCITEINPKDAAQLVERYIGLAEKSAEIVIKACKDFLEWQRGPT
jgi:hypothetical protein